MGAARTRRIQALIPHGDGLMERSAMMIPLILLLLRAHADADISQERRRDILISMLQARQGQGQAREAARER